MSRPFELTPFAKTSLVEIVVWTVENFGNQQADLYEILMLKTCEDIAARTAQVRDCSYLTGDARPSGIMFARAGRHFVLFQETGERVVILDFLHSASNLVFQVKALKNASGING